MPEQRRNDQTTPLLRGLAEVPVSGQGTMPSLNQVKGLTGLTVLQLGLLVALCSHSGALSSLPEASRHALLDIIESVDAEFQALGPQGIVTEPLRAILFNLRAQMED
jgi:hypothetical protein